MVLLRNKMGAEGKFLFFMNFCFSVGEEEQDDSNIL